MKILLVAATEFEISPTIEFLKKNSKIDGANYILGEFTIQILVTGVGAPTVIYNLMKKFSKEDFDLIIQAGIAGTFNLNISLGTVVEVAVDTFADIGVEENNGSFTTVFEMELTDSNLSPYTNGWLKNNTTSGFNFLQKVVGITVNKVSGTSESIKKIKAKYPNAEVETMEGAAFNYVCLLEGKKFVQIRGISNLVEPRNKNNWDIQLAISKLNNVVIEIIS